MNESLHNLSEVVAKANDSFFERHTNVDTVMGLMDKTLRNQGMNADAITIDCLAMNKKIVLVLHDIKPEHVDIAIGDKDGVIHSSTEHALENVTVKQLINLMEDNFLPR